MTRTALAAFAIVVVSITPNAFAQASFCSVLTQVGQEAGSRFRTLRAGRDSTGDYSSKIVLPNANSCYITADSDSDYICVWRLGFDVDGKQHAKRFAEAIRDCYPNGRFQPDSKGSAYNHRYNGVKFRVRHDVGNRVFLRIERDQ